ncbi:hypothetical protein CF335_g5595 [Tilletia laevis]|nr:hypothetical protein CF335_g5595 [Tilletia laevis]
METILHQRGTASKATTEYLSVLYASGWFTLPKQTTAHTDLTRNIFPEFTAKHCKVWKREIATYDNNKKQLAAAPQATHGVLAENLGFNLDNSEPTVEANVALRSDPIAPQPTVRLFWNESCSDQLINALSDERKLNNSQRLAFAIVANQFFNEMHNKPQQPLRLLMHGAAGTGKTVVVRLLRELLERYGMGKRIMIMAPTGKAASAIGGTTQHAAFSIPVQQKSQTADELRAHQHDLVTGKRIQKLQTVFRDIQWIFLDEVSMTSSEMLCEIDQALRIGKNNLETAFGGINIMLAGDLCQLPPVGQTALYTKSYSPWKPAESGSKAALGRATWLQVDTVVEFTEQMRMKDETMANALSRLRLRQCTDADVRLFNTNVVRSASYSTGVTLQDSPETVVLARTNETVRVLNHKKATSEGLATGKFIAVAHAEDTATTSMDAETRETLFSYSGGKQTKCLGRIPLFVGMPVIFRGGNQSLSMGVTNGAFATVAGFDIVKNKWGKTTARGVFLRFGGLEALRLHDLPEGCYPVARSTSTFNFVTTKDGEGIRVTRRQLPIQPGFAMTIHSAQGITAEGGVVVDLRKGGFETYVAASRATRPEKLFLLAPISINDLNQPKFPFSLTQELRRLSVCAEITRTQYAKYTTDVGTGQKRRLDAEPDSPSKRQQTCPE